MGCVKAAQNPCRLFRLVGKADVQLRDLGTVDGPRVLDGGRQPQDLVPQAGLASEPYGLGRLIRVQRDLFRDGGADVVAVGEKGVAQAVVKGVTDREIVSVEVSAVDTHPLDVVTLQLLADGQIIGWVLGHDICQFSTGFDIAVKNIEDGHATILAQQGEIENSGYVLELDTGVNHTWSCDVDYDTVLLQLFAT